MSEDAHALPDVPGPHPGRGWGTAGPGGLLGLRPGGQRWPLLGAARGGAGTAGAPGRGHRPICSTDKVATGRHDDAPGPRRMCWRQGESLRSQQAASDAKEVSHTCSWAGMHRPAATRRMSQTPTGTAHTGGLTPRDRPDIQTARAHTAPPRPRQTPTGGPPTPGPPTRPTQRPDTDQASSITWEAVHLRSQELTLCRPPASVCTVCACVSVWVQGETTSEARALLPIPPHRYQAPAPSPGCRPPTTAPPSYLERWGDARRHAGHPVAISADSSWEGPPRSAQHPGHHVDSQAWGSPTALAAGEAQGSAGRGAASRKESQTVILRARSWNLSGDRRTNGQNRFLDDSKRSAFLTLTFSQAGVPRSFPETT